MSQLAIVSIISGSVLLGLHLLLVLRPRTAVELIKGFPRSVLPGRILTAVDVGWITALLLCSGMKWVERHQYLVVLSGIAVLALIIVFMNELLAARALGGLFLLVPLPILDAAFVHPSNSRLVMTVFAYVLAVLGIILVWSPFMFRKMTAGWIAVPMRARAAGLAGCLAGLGMIMLGLLAY